MKKFYLLVGLIIYGALLKAQTNTFPSSGNVGIGTLTPSAKLTIRDESIGGLLSVGSNANIAATIGLSPYASGLGNDYWKIIANNSGQSYRLDFTAGGTNHLAIKYDSGNVGIGTTSPTEKLDVSGNINWSGFNSGNARALKVGYSGGNYGGIGYNIGYTSTTGIFNRPFNDQSSYLEFHYGGFRFFGTSNATSASGVTINGGGTNLNLLATMTSAGNFGIGISSLSEKLAVNGNIRAKEVKVENANWPDYVFTKGYELPSLQSTEQHIKANGHLPGIPSAAEVKANGVDLGEMNAKLLQKIEELTLHLIEKEKELNLQNTRIKKLEEAVFTSKRKEQ